MKVFGCKTSLPYSGGVILVAANNIDEAFKTMIEDNSCKYLWESYNADGWCEPNAENAIISSDWYPKDKWQEFTELSCNCDKPKVIIEDSHEG